MAPAPELADGNVTLWRVFERLTHQRGSWAFAGMDGIPEGMRPEAVRENAQAAGLPWTEDVQDGFAICEAFWKAEVDRLVAAERARLEQQNKSKARR